MQKELTKRLAGTRIERSCFQRRLHVFQPRASLSDADPEARVRFPQAQPPSGLGLLFISTEELDEKSAERFYRAPEAFAWE